MKKVIGLLLFFLLNNSIWAQEIFHLNDDKKILLNKGWKFKMGDEQSWASPQFDDKTWKSINPAVDIHDSLPPEALKGIGWMRMRFIVDKHLRDKSLALVIHQSISSEIYLNGKLIKIFGTVSSDPSKVKAWDPIYKPIVFPISHDSIQTLAVRFAIQAGIKYTTIFETFNSIMNIKSVNHEEAMDFYQKINNYQTGQFLVGICIMFFIIHFSFYLFNRTQKANLYFSLFGIIFIFFPALQRYFYFFSNEVDTKYVTGNLAFLFIMLSDLAIMNAIYIFLEKRTDALFKLIIFYFSLAVVLNASQNNMGWRFGGPIFEALVYINITRISLIAAKQNKPGAKLFVFGAITSIVLFIVFIVEGTFTKSYFLEELSIWRNAMFVLHVLALPAAVSFFLAKDFALTSKRLALKLLEVNGLYEKNLAIETKNKEILALQNQQLETLVEERTSALQNSLLELKSSQAQLIQSEKMASLGQLIAGIAHEINTPLGAIKASVGTIIESSFQSLKQLPKLVKRLTNREFALFLDLVNRSVQSNSQITSKEEREHRKYLTVQLEKLNIENADNSADLLVDMAVYDNIEQYLPIFNDQSLQAAFHLSQQMKNSQNIKTAVERASKIVFALKNYARFSNTEEMVLADIPSTIETVLTLYHNQLKLGINVVKEFEEVPQILCYPDELNQVWTNLIYNAVQAMDGKGELTISVSKCQTCFANQSGLVIRLGDTGNGIAPEIKEKIFDAFYTTKSAGEGSGLGLYIVKQIIDKHKGKISVESEVGKGTTFILELPVIK